MNRLAYPLIVLALLVFWVRGPRRAVNDSGDFATVYAASRCWLAQENPYAEANVERQYSLGHGDPKSAPNAELTASVYLPTMFPLAATVSWLDWPAAERAWLALNIAAFGLSLFCLARSVSKSGHSLIVAAAFLLFSPVHTGIAKGQPSVICISLLVAALCLEQTKPEAVLAGIFLGLSCCIKPNIALPFLLFFCWRRQWRAVAVSVATGALVSALALKNMLALPPGWWNTWSANLKMAALPSGNMNPTIASGGSHFLVNFQTLVGFFTANQRICDLVTYTLLGGLALAVLAVTKLKLDPWQALALLATLVLLVSYHRYYDLPLLMLCTAATLQLWKNPTPLVWLGAAFALPLWLPLQALAAGVMPVPAPGSASLIQFLAFRNQPLCLSALALLFAYVLMKNRPARNNGS